VGRPFYHSKKVPRRPSSITIDFVQELLILLLEEEDVMEEGVVFYMVQRHEK
jgi:hypothetical protein